MHQAVGAYIKRMKVNQGDLKGADDPLHLALKVPKKAGRSFLVSHDCISFLEEEKKTFERGFPFCVAASLLELMNLRGYSCFSS